MLARVGAPRLILISAVMTAIRWTGLAITADPTAIAVLQLLQCFTLAGNNAAIMWHIAARAPATAKTPRRSRCTRCCRRVFMFASIQLAARCTGTMRPAASW